MYLQLMYLQLMYLQLMYLQLMYLQLMYLQLMYLQLMYLQSHIYKNIPVSFDFTTTVIPRLTSDPANEFFG